MPFVQALSHRQQKPSSRSDHNRHDSNAPPERFGLTREIDPVQDPFMEFKKGRSFVVVFFFGGEGRGEEKGLLILRVGVETAEAATAASQTGAAERSEGWASRRDCVDCGSRSFHRDGETECVCVCVRERERERGDGLRREMGRGLCSFEEGEGTILKGPLFYFIIT